ncbi:hypothetical protein CVS40_6349 [Lucilia cuprina]|nr:hypothetical protein CVS40_6349 [Lucilia cuprina]
MNVVALSVEELHHKLSEILNLMNTKYSLNPENNAMFSPDINQTLIFEIYLNSLSLNIKTLLIQNNIATISGAQSYLIENNLMKDVYLRKNSYTNNSREKNFDKGRKTGNYGQNFNNRSYKPNPQNMTQPSGNNYDKRGSGQYRNTSYEQRGSGQYRNTSYEQRGSGQYRNTGYDQRG